jgi:hypothetical protein
MPPLYFCAYNKEADFHVTLLGKIKQTAECRLFFFFDPIMKTSEAYAPEV